MTASIGHLAWVTERPLNPQWAPTHLEYESAAGGGGGGGVGGGGGCGGVDAGGGSGDGGGGGEGEAGGSDSPQALQVATRPPPAAPGPLALSAHLTSSRRMASGPWWPCEVVDPWRPPLGFLFLLDHMTALDEHERRAYVPGDVARGVADAAVWSAAGGGGGGVVGLWGCGV